MLTRYGPMGASSRMRTFQFLPAMADAGWDVVVSPFFADGQLTEKYRHGGYGATDLLQVFSRRIKMMIRRKQFDLVWIEKEALPWLPSSIESWLLRGVPYVLDFDDALFHNYDRHRSSLVRSILGRRLDRLMKSASLIVAGNSYLAARAVESGARWVEIMPTVVDLDRYAVASGKEVDPLRVVWIGSPSTTRYLRLLERPLASLSRKVPFRFRVIGGGEFAIPGVDIESMPWSERAESNAIAECHVGVMPLYDTPWEKGKCAYKLIQYMASGLPGVASPVGANCDVIIEGTNGFFADTEATWVQRLELLLTDATLRDRMGGAGRSLVEAKYCLKVTAPRLIGLLAQVPGRYRGT